MKQLKVLVIDDEKLIRWSFEKQLKSKGYQVYSAETGEEGLEKFKLYQPDVLFIDNKLPKMQGLEVIAKVKSIDEDVTIIFMTAYGSIEMAVKAMKIGATDYLNKPFSLKEIDIILNNIRKKLSLNKEIQLLKRQKKEDITFDHIVGESSEMKQIIQLSKKIARTETTTILLLGESGTGKDVFARAIHNESPRKEKPFVTINCSSLPETLLESELFGHEKGAFTDAGKLKKGLFEIAENGTVFLDEIGEINLATQVKLLGVLENRIVRRLGGTVDIPIQIRIIAATNRDLMKSVEEKTFREDLYYRLKVFQLTLPPLRQHKDDIQLLVEFFISLFNNQFNKKVKSIDRHALQLLEAYDWPGNIRELRNVMERAVILESDENIVADHLPIEIVTSNSPENKINPSGKFEIPRRGFSLEEFEREMIKQALEKSNQNQTTASKMLGISRDTLRYKKKKYNL